VAWIIPLLALTGLAILVDSQRRFGKAVWWLGALVPVTAGLTAVAYLVLRALREPDPDAPRGPRMDWRFAVGCVLLAALTGASFHQAFSIQERKAQVQASTARNSERGEAIARYADPYERALARKDEGLTYEWDLREVPVGHPRYADAQRLLAPFNRQRAREREAARKAEADRVPRHTVVEDLPARRRGFGTAVALKEGNVSVRGLTNLIRHLLLRGHGLGSSSIQIYDAENAAGLTQLYPLRPGELGGGLIANYRKGRLTYILPGQGHPVTVSLDDAQAGD
jgi:hypothetical protein